MNTATMAAVRLPFQRSFAGALAAVLLLCASASGVLAAPATPTVQEVQNAPSMPDVSRPFREFDGRIDELYLTANRVGDAMERLAQQGELDRSANDTLGFLLALTGQQLDNVRDLLYLLRFALSEDGGDDGDGGSRTQSVALHVATRLKDIADSQGLQLMIVSGLAGPQAGPRAKSLLQDFSGYVEACRDMARDLAVRVTAKSGAAQ